jgi:hypothetical protein
MEISISGVHADMYPIIAPLELRAGIALFSPLNLFFTDGSLVDGVEMLNFFAILFFRKKIST